MSENAIYDPAFFDSVLEMVRQIPIAEIIYDTYAVPNGICPFHNDRNAGSFSVIKRLNRYHCFSCGEKGDGIRFVREQEHIGFVPAVWKLALQFGIVTVEQMNEYMSGNLSNHQIKKPPRIYDGVFIDQEENELAEPEVLHNVFSLFAEGESILPGKQRLSSKHLQHLKEDRHLTIGEVEKAGYFTMPRRTSLFVRHFTKELKERFGYDIEVLKHIPGFYWLEKTNQPTFVGHTGIGIPVKDEKEQISGIQIRRDSFKAGESRYIWFSSSFANEKEGMSDGTGSGSPIHVSYPNVNRRPTELFITEGIFKSEQIAKHYQATCLSVQGVQSWKGKTDRIIEYLEEEKGQAVLHIHIFFDADVSCNIHVYSAFRQMYEFLKDSFPNVKFDYHWWRMEYGKGSDDVLLNGLAQEIHSVDCKIYVEVYDKMLKELEETYGESPSELGKEFIEQAYAEHVTPLFYP